MATRSCFYHATRLTSHPILLSCNLHSRCPHLQPSYAVFPSATLSRHEFTSSINSFTRLSTQEVAVYQRHSRLCCLSSASAAQKHQDAISNTSVISLLPGQAHIWWLNPTQYLEDADAIQYCSRLLPPEERDECLSASNPLAQNERLLARGFLRTVLSQYLLDNSSSSPSILQFKRNSFGKPDMQWPCTTPAGHEVQFNLTHTDGLIGVSVTVDSLIGLDVEVLNRKTRRDPLKLATRRFSTTEVEQLRQLEADKELQTRKFMQIWTLKESYIKALGKGIYAKPGLQSYSFQINPPVASQGDGGCSSISFSTPLINRDDATKEEAKRDWQFILLQPTGQHIAAVCIERNSSSNQQPSVLTSYQGSLPLLGADKPTAVGVVMDTIVTGIGFSSSSD